MTFNTLPLSQPLQNRLKKLNYTQPTEIQRKAIPIILSGKDILAAAQTGTGKTAAFGLPILHQLSQTKKSCGTIKALIVAPTRELAAQIEQSLDEYGKDLGISTAVVYGGVKIGPQIARLQERVDILVATPGRLLDLHQQKALSLAHCQCVVLDEADRMLDMGFIHDIRRIFSILPKKRQTLLFSATFSKSIRALAKQFVYQAIEVSVTPPNSTAQTVNQLICTVEKKQKSALLTNLIYKENWQQALVFTRTKHGANKLAQQLSKADIHAAAIHGNKSQSARTKALNGFKCKWSQYLLVIMWATRLEVAIDLGIKCLGIGAIDTLLSQRLQAYLGRTVAMTFTEAGMTSNCSVTSSPMCFLAQPQSQTLSASSISTMTSSRGKFSGNGLRLAFLRS